MEFASWVSEGDRVKFTRLGRLAAEHFLEQTRETWRPDMGKAVEAVSTYDDGTGAALEIGKAAYRHMRRKVCREGR